MILFTAILFTMLLFAWVITPMLKTGTQNRNVTDVLAQEREHSLLISLKELHDKKETIPESDFVPIENRLMIELAKIYQERGVNPTANPNSDGCPQCGFGQDESHKFCIQCGTAL